MGCLRDRNKKSILAFKCTLQWSDKLKDEWNVFTTHSLRWTLGDLNINIIHKKSIPSIAKLISTVSDSNVNICRLCEKTTYCFVYVFQICFKHFPTNQGEIHFYCSLFKSDFFFFCLQIHFSTQMKTGMFWGWFKVYT
jgi:hypothetical protein